MRQKNKQTPIRWRCLTSVWSYNLFIRNSTVVINDDYSCSLNLSEIILPKFLKVHGANSLNLSGGLTTLVRVCFIGEADTGSRGMFGQLRYWVLVHILLDCFLFHQGQLQQVLLWQRQDALPERHLLLAFPLAYDSIHSFVLSLN